MAAPAKCSWRDRNLSTKKKEIKTKIRYAHLSDDSVLGENTAPSLFSTKIAIFIGKSDSNFCLEQ